MRSRKEKRVPAKCRKCKADGTLPIEPTWPKDTARVEVECPDCSHGWHEIRFFDAHGNRINPMTRKAS